MGVGGKQEWNEVATCSGYSQILMFFSFHMLVYPSSFQSNGSWISYPGFSMFNLFQLQQVQSSSNSRLLGGGNNIGRVGVITHEEKHPGSFEMVHIKVGKYRKMGRGWKQRHQRKQQGD